jgi:CheY-like chemotaxis protein
LITPDAARFKYLDTNGDGRASVGDAVYADVLAIASHRIDVGDVRITAFEDEAIGVHVESGDGDVGSSIATMGDLNQVVAYADADGSNAFSTGDSMYLRGAASSSASAARLGDVRLGGHDASAFGTWLDLGDYDAPARLRRATDVQACLAGDGEYEPGDTILLRTSPCTGTDSASDHVLAGPSATGDRLNSLDADLIFQNREGGSGFDEGDLLFLDLNIPGTSGAEVLRVLKSDPDTADVRVIIVTATGQEGRDYVLSLGADEYFTKPFSPLILRELMEEAQR